MILSVDGWMAEVSARLGMKRPDDQVVDIPSRNTWLRTVPILYITSPAVQAQSVSPNGWLPRRGLVFLASPSSDMLNVSASFSSFSEEDRFTGELDSAGECTRTTMYLVARSSGQARHSRSLGRTDHGWAEKV